MTKSYSMKSKKKPIKKKKLSEGQMAERAARSAFVKLVRERRKTGETLILSRNGKAVEVPASEIPDSALRARYKVR